MDQDKLNSAEYQGKGPLVFGTTVGFSADLLLKGQLSWFRRQGWQVVLITSPDKDAERAVEREGSALHGIDMKREISLLHDIRALWKWTNSLRKIRPTAINLASPKASLLGGIAAWLAHVPKRVYVVWGLRLEGTQGPIGFVLRMMERLTIALATDVVVVSESLGRQLHERRLTGSKPLWLVHEGSSNGVDAREILEQTIDIQGEELRRSIGLKPDPFTIGYVGRINHDKGFNTLIQAFQNESLDPSIQLVIIGTVEDQELETAIESVGSKARIIPWTADVWRYYAAMDALCLPTKREGFPNVVLEAASAGVPAVTTTATGAVDSVIDGVTGLIFETGDTGMLIQHLNLLASNREYAQKLGAAARSRAQARFQPPLIWAGIESILEGKYDYHGLRKIDLPRDLGSE
ncbi:glycosyltransferase family 4 protein [Yaniella halotolerans]|uniref:glycosyltransferase family 4 protein n=1 Tax=Yaniella halotolerans TaxID=225453 RepID=UPI0004168BF6|nr:glycosyltransferase family 4 protein [Yaniella halotolerans]